MSYPYGNTMLRRGQFFISLIVVALAIGCAPLVKKAPEEITAVPEEKPPEEIAEVPEKRFGKIFFSKAREHENKGELVAALQHYSLAITVDPLNHEALEGQNRLKTALHNLAEEHYKEGLRFHKQGKYGRARHQFLIALRLRPDYPEVIEMLTSRKRVQIKRYIVHTIKPGESLSKLAKIYYGDYHQFPIIARYNNIIDATKVYVDQKIKVPEIEGMEFLVGEAAVNTEEMEVPGEGSLALEGEAFTENQTPEPKAEEGEHIDQVTIYRDHGIELFKKKRYQEAIVEFTKVLNVYPEDHVALEYSYNSYFQNAMALFENKDYLAARDQLLACLRYKHDCQACHRYIKTSEDLYKELHYKRGIQFYDKELLHEAIKEWELVKALDPNYKRTEYLIDRSKTILEKIEELKRGQDKSS